MTTSYGNSCNEVVIRVHHSLVVYQIVKNPQNLRNFVVLRFFSLGCDAHLQVHLLLQSFGVKFVKKALLLI